jgi:hypothetical protein
MMASRLLPIDNRDVNLDAALDPSSAQFQLWLAQMKRDHCDLSGREMGKVESAVQPMAKKSRTMFNPFTGEIRKVEI